MTDVINIHHKNYIIQDRIGSGKFGSVYKGYHIRTNNKVAVKVESCNSSYITLKNEAKILRYLSDNKCREVPSIHWYGNIDNYLVLILPRYDCSLYELRQNTNVDKVLIDNLMTKMLYIIQEVHKSYVVHRDIKPHHFMVSNGHLTLIDFGISTFFVDENKKKIKNNHKECIIGSKNYCSYFIHEGHNYSPRDDLLSIGYIYLFLNYGKLPWENINKEYDTTMNEIYVDHPKNQDIMHSKSFEQLQSLVFKLDNNFGIFLQKVYQCDYYEDPNYIDLLALFLY
jgi:serine/threonine protein kinase